MLATCSSSSGGGSKAPRMQWELDNRRLCYLPGEWKWCRRWRQRERDFFFRNAEVAPLFVPKRSRALFFFLPLDD